MKPLNPAVRKLVYLALIGVLIIPLSFIALPGTRHADGSARNQGGRLSVLRDEYNLSQAKLSEIDPASQTMRLVSLGLRGVAVCSQWMQAMEYKKTENYDQLASTLKTLTRIQPNFVKVWDFQAHNLAYNVSMEFDDYEYRYHWVKKGLAFLKEGIAHNKTDHRIFDYLGFYTGNKMGKSDERDSFRRMFGLDSEFHEEMEQYINRDTYETRGYGHDYDSWLMSWQWYDYSRTLVDHQSGSKYRTDMIFYNFRPTARRNQGLSLQKEFRPDESQKQVWNLIRDEWTDYGNIEMSSIFGLKYTMEGLYQTELKLEQLRHRLDELVPGTRTQLTDEALSQLNFPEEYLIAWKLPVEERDDEQRQWARSVISAINNFNQDIDVAIARQADPSASFEALRIANEIEEEKARQYAIEKDAENVNYAFWKWRSKAESSDIGLAARESLFLAEEARQKAIYDDEFDRDYKTGEIQITKLGALSFYHDAFEKFKLVFEENPFLKGGVYGDEVVEEIKKYQTILKLTGRDWPRDFVLQEFIDFRDRQALDDDLPTSESIRDTTIEVEDHSEEDAQPEPADTPPTKSDATSESESASEPPKSEPGP